MVLLWLDVAAAVTAAITWRDMDEEAGKLVCTVVTRWEMVVVSVELKVPTQIRVFFTGSRISAMYRPDSRRLTMRYFTSTLTADTFRKSCLAIERHEEPHPHLCI
jgi:hypothetical protein